MSSNWTVTVYAYAGLFIEDAHIASLTQVQHSTPLYELLQAVKMSWR